MKDIDIRELETENLILRKARIMDSESLFRNYWSDPLSSKYMLWDCLSSIDEAKERIKRTIEFQKSKLAFIIEEKGTGEVIGLAGFKEIEVGIFEDCGIGIGSKYFRKGYGKQILNVFIDYIFNKLNGKKIICSCFPENIASAKLQESCGLKFVGKKHSSKIDGEMFYYEINNKLHSEH